MQSVITELVADYVQVVTIDTCYTKIIYNLLMLISVTLGLCASLYCYIYNPVQVVITQVVPIFYRVLNIMYTILTWDIQRRRVKLSTIIKSHDEITLEQKI